MKFRNWDCEIMWSTYTNGRPAIKLVDSRNSMPIATATINLPDVEELDDHHLVAIKDYAENEGMLSALMEAGIISAPVGEVVSGFVAIPVCELLVEPK